MVMSAHSRRRRGILGSPTRATATLLPLVGLTALVAALRSAPGNGLTGQGSWLEAAVLALPIAVLLGSVAGGLTSALRRSLRDDPLAVAAEYAAVAAIAVGSLAVSAAAQSLLMSPAAGGRGAAASALLALRSLPFVLLGALALRIVVVTSGRLPTLRKAHLRRALVPALAAVIGLGTLTTSPLMSATPADAAGADGPCPANVPQKTYDVESMNVDIPLNRFGDHDAKGRMYVLSNRVDDVAAEAKSQKVSIGLRNDAIQPLVIRANQGDCVTINYTNKAEGGEFGLHIDGLSYAIAQSGDAIGRNPASNPKTGESRTYTYYVPNDDSLEGAHYLHPGPGFRNVVNHGLFGALVVEPPGSTYLDPNAVDEDHAKAIESGWEAIIRPAGRAEFRENVQLYHEIGNEDEKDAVLKKDGTPVAFIDPHSDAYRPNTRAINYRSEAFMNRLDAAPEQEAHGYGSYTFGDPATPMPRGYQADPTKFRILHAGTEMFHVFHMHGGGIRWRFNPVADPTYNYEDTGLNKHPVEASDSSRLDSQAFGPGESYNLEIEGGAGGVQQGAGDFLFHCHIAEHYVAGMWSFWRVYNTRQPDFAPLADRVAPPEPVDSQALIGHTYGGQKITEDNLADWIRPQLPPAGVRLENNDATVWNWSVNADNPLQYLGEPEDNSNWPDYENKVPGHPTAMPGDTFVGNRPVLLFDPTNGRPAYPMMRPHLGMRPPFSPNGHSGAPYLGENGDQAVKSGPKVDTWAKRADGICPSTTASGAPTPLRRFNVVAVEKSVQVTPKDSDPTGQVYVLAHDKAAVMDGTKPFAPLALRANVGDCVAVTLTSELTDINSPSHFSQVNMHIHHVQFDTQASDGVITGMSYEQAVRPYKLEDPQLTQPAAKGDTVLHLASVAKFQVGVYIGVGLGTEGPEATGTANAATSGRGPEIRAITSIDKTANTVTLAAPLEIDHAAGQYAGVEFEQYRWYPDVNLDNIFWHDHVDGIHTWAHGLVGQLIVEPEGSTYHDPRTGNQVDSGAIVDIHANKPLAAGAGVTGSFREVALWEMDKGFGATQDSMFNLRADPLSDRNLLTDPSLQFSSYAHGDPITPLPRAYPGDPLVIRTIQVGSAVDTLGIDGHRFFYENRYVGAGGKAEAEPLDTLHYGISERFTLILQGGAGGPRKASGDYLYFNGVDRRLADGAWGIIRVLPGRVTTDENDPNYLKPLPGTDPGTSSAAFPPSGTTPPEPDSPGNPCEAGSAQRSFDITAVRTSNTNTATRYTYVPTSKAAAAANSTTPGEPLVMHMTAGDCVTVKVTNKTGIGHIGFMLRGLDSDRASAGVNIGYNPESTIADGASRTYVYSVDNDRVGGGTIGDLSGNTPGAGAGSAKRGLYGGYTVAPKGSTFTDPVTGNETGVGAAVDVHVPGHKDYRDFSLILSDDDPQLGASFMPYPVGAEKPNAVLINYKNAPRNDSLGNAFSSAAFGDPATPLLRAYAGDPMVVHAFGAPGSEQTHAFNLGGLNFAVDEGIKAANLTQTRAVGPWESATMHVLGGAGSTSHTPGDYFYGDLRRPFTQAGMWGLQRVLPKPVTCPPPNNGQPLCLDSSSASPTVDFPAPPSDPTNQNTLKIPFTSSDPDARFECSLSTGPAAFAPCKSPFSAKGLADGTWTLQVRATSRAGWSGATQQVRFTVDRVAPRTSATPPGGLYAAAQQVTLNSTEPGQIRYTLDGTVPGMSSPTYTGPVTVDRTSMLRFVAIDPAGNVSSEGQEVYTIAAGGTTGAGTGGSGTAGTQDVNPPRVSSPTIVLGKGSVSARGNVPVEVRWGASDTSGVSRYQLWLRTDGGRPVPVALASPTTTQLTTALAANHRYTFVVTATDGVGNVTPQVSGVATSVSLRQESSASLAYAGKWRTVAGSAYSAGKARESSSRGSSAMLTVPSGSRAGLLLGTGRDKGMVKVIVNGASRSAVTLDLYRARAGVRQVVWQAPPGTRTVRLVVLGTRNRHSLGRRLDVDAVVLLGG
jgi:hypothetical protein